jgi:hypothetical protein
VADEKDCEWALDEVLETVVDDIDAVAVAVAGTEALTFELATVFTGGTAWAFADVGTPDDE